MKAMRAAMDEGRGDRRGSRVIVGIGSDLCDIRRIEQTLERFGDRFIARCFTEIERRSSEAPRRARRLLRQAIRRQGGLRQGARHRPAARRVLARHGRRQSALRPADHASYRRRRRAAEGDPAARDRRRSSISRSPTSRRSPRRSSSSRRARRAEPGSLEELGVSEGGRIPWYQGKAQGIPRFWADFGKTMRKMLNNSNPFQKNSLRGRAGKFFRGAGKPNSLLRRKQGYLAPETPSVDLSERGRNRKIGRHPDESPSIMGQLSWILAPGRSPNVRGQTPLAPVCNGRLHKGSRPQSSVRPTLVAPCRPSCPQVNVL